MDSNIGIKPQPAPINEGIEVTPLLLDYPDLKLLITNRHNFGLKKYRQGLKTGDKRDSVEDSLQELGDLIQYLYKAKLQKIQLTKEQEKTLYHGLLICDIIIDDLKD